MCRSGRPGLDPTRKQAQKTSFFTSIGFCNRTPFVFFSRCSPLPVFTSLPQPRHSAVAAATLSPPATRTTPATATVALIFSSPEQSLDRLVQAATASFDLCSSSRLLRFRRRRRRCFFSGDEYRGSDSVKALNPVQAKKPNRCCLCLSLCREGGIHYRA